MEQYSPSTTVSDVGQIVGPTQEEQWIGAFVAGLSGWTLDAFDFFLVVFSLTAIGRTFGQDDKHVALALTATLALRPVGAFIFGGISDRYGRRIPLIINLVLFACVEVMTGLAHSFMQFLVLRAIFGMVMGGQWGVGVSLAMEKVPVRLRGILSGLLQQGYAMGYLLAAVAFFSIFDRWSWRPLFFLGSLPALSAALFVAVNVKESKVATTARQHSWGALGRTFLDHWKLFAYFTVFMMAMHMSSHGTQDMYPTFLERQWGVHAQKRAVFSSLSMIGAILGGLTIGSLSDRLGRRHAMMISIGGAVLIIPLWAFSHSLPLLVVGAIVMQFFVQGAWGVVPAHLAEMSPSAIRGSLPGLGNQCGVLLASSVIYLEAALAHRFSYSTAMASTATVVFLLAMSMVFIGQEKRATTFAA
jgi:SHS family lactate transporter-like MFS transporter